MFGRRVDDEFLRPFVKGCSSLNISHIGSMAKFRKPKAPVVFEAKCVLQDLLMPLSAHTRY